jgi:hypothetical protein
VIDIHEVPDEARAAAYQAFDMVDGTAGVADIVFDSVVDLPGDDARGERLLRFESLDQTVELRVSVDDDGALAVDVSLRPPATRTLEVRRPDSHEIVVVRDGRASFKIPPGLVSVVLDRTEDRGGRLATAWVCV